jgi:Skp family chaperone for outer membrane proteins
MSKRTIKQIIIETNTIFPKIDSDARSLTGNVNKLKAFSPGANTGITAVGTAPQATLQEATQKYQQYIQTFSTLLKSYQDTNTSTLQKPSFKELKSLILKTQSDITNLSRKLAQLESYTQELKSAGDGKQENQLANIDLQNALQKQQQLFQTLSNVTKQMHDNALDIIRKMG